MNCNFVFLNFVSFKLFDLFFDIFFVNKSIFEVSLKDFNNLLFIDDELFLVKTKFFELKIFF